MPGNFGPGHPMHTSSTLVLVLAVFGACLVEMVEALTLVVAAGVSRGWRSALEGAAAAPSSAERQPLLTPAAMTRVSASTISTRLAPNTARTRTRVEEVCMETGAKATWPTAPAVPVGAAVSCGHRPGILVKGDGCHA